MKMPSVITSYFAYGAMTNPHSRDLRHVHPGNFRAAILHDYALHFSPTGFATVCPENGSKVHGVVMDFDSLEEWQVIQQVEAAYNLHHEKVETYDGDWIEACAVFCLEHFELGGRPQERYLKIIAQGLEYHGVDPQYIQELFKFDYRPSRKPENYLSFPCPTDLPTISFQDYVKRSQTQPCFVVHDRVVDLVGEYDASSPLIKILFANHIGKKDCTEGIMKAVYDPDMPETEPWKWAENHIVDVTTSMGMNDNFRVSFRLESAEE
jgi:hypothetical protein